MRLGTMPPGAPANGERGRADWPAIRADFALLCHDIPAAMPSRWLTSTAPVAPPALAPPLAPSALAPPLSPPAPDDVYWGGLHAYLTGDFATAVAWHDAGGSRPALGLMTGANALASAISLGRLDQARRISAELDAFLTAGSELAAQSELLQATIRLCAWAMENTPAWLVTPDFRRILPNWQVYAGYAHALYLLNTGQTAQALTAATLIHQMAGGRGLRFQQYALPLLMARAELASGNHGAAADLVTEVAHLLLPHRFITPLAEQVTVLGGLVEEVVGAHYPDLAEPIEVLGVRLGTNWLEAHNFYTGTRVEPPVPTLTLRHHHIANQVAAGMPVAEVARHMHLSPGRVRNLLTEVYRHYGITSRAELHAHLHHR